MPHPHHQRRNGAFQAAPPARDMPLTLEIFTTHGEVWFNRHVWIVTGRSAEGKIRLMRSAKRETKRREVWPRQLLGVKGTA